MDVTRIFKKIIAKDRSVAFDGENNAPIITGDINAPVTIDARSLDGMKLSKKAELFANNVPEDQLPYLWAARNCFQLLSQDTTLHKLEVKADIVPEAIIVNLLENHQSLDSDYSQLKLFLYQKKSCKKIRLVTIFTEVFKHFLNIDTSEIDLHVIINFSLDSKSKTYLEDAKKGIFKGRFFNSNLDKVTGLPITSLRALVPNIEFHDIESEYNACEYKLNNAYGHDSNGSSSEVFQALSATFYEAENNNKPAIIDNHEIEIRLGVTNIGDLFPSQPVFDPLPIKAKRINHDLILKSLLKQETNCIIHASGGVGKTVLARLFCQQMPSGSHGVVYDCFGSGQYRTISRPRHSADKVLVQIINELASEGLCAPLLVHNQNNDVIFKGFVNCIEQALSTLKTISSDAQLILFIDAADNAEMAAKEHAEISIVRHLLNEFYIEDCKIVALCRSERIGLLEPRDEVTLFELPPFEESESFAHLLQYFPDAKQSDGLEFHRLSGGNPRVQANAMDACKDSLTEMLINLGPRVSTVDDQIEEQLDRVIKALKKRHIKSEGNQIEQICIGLATLPPFIPLTVLAGVAGLSEDAIRSFVSDLGRPLLIFDNAVQFRDEPTETWFRKRFIASQEQACDFLDILKPLASRNSYVAESLPHLMLAAERYDDLIELALSEDLLPLDNPIDARSIRVSRLQSALKAALSKNRYADAIKLALRSGEENASDKRQLELLHKNVGLIGSIQSKYELQKIAFQGKLSGAWRGSKNLYTASLLSTVDEYKGEARSYFRAANRWLSHYFENKNDSKDQHAKLEHQDIAELFSTIHNLGGEKKVYQYIKSWQPEEHMHGAIKIFSRRLLDNCDFSALNSLVEKSLQSPYICLHFIKKLHSVSHKISITSINICIQCLSLDDENINRINKSISTDNILSLIEASMAAGVDTKPLTTLYHKYIRTEAKTWLCESHSFSDEREMFLRSTALRLVLTDEPINIDNLLSSELVLENKSYKNDDNEKKFRQVIGALLPYYVLRVKLMTNQPLDCMDEIEKADKLSKSSSSGRYIGSDFLPGEVISAKMSCLLYGINLSHEQQVESVSPLLTVKSPYKQSDALNHLYLSCRLENSDFLSESLENYCFTQIKNYKDTYPEDIASGYISLAKSILPLSKEQASKYFDDAVTSLSKFGDEALSRFMAILALANESGKAKVNSPELVYRFARCTEVFGKDIREKHFPRAEALGTIHLMHPSSSFSLLARWLDREVIYLGRVQPHLLQVAVESGSLAPSAAWASTGFIDWYSYIDFANTCLSYEKDENIKLLIFEDAVKQVLLRDLPLKELTKLQKIGAEHGLHSVFLDESIEKLGVILSNKCNLERPNETVRLSNRADVKINWYDIFEGKPQVSADYIMRALERCQTTDQHINQISFWDKYFSEFTSINGAELIDSILDCDFDGEYQLECALERVPTSWMSRPIVREKWLNAFEIFVTRNALRVCGPWWLGYSKNRFPLKDELEGLLISGVIKGLSNYLDSLDSESLFSIVSLLSKCVTPEDAQHCLDYALTRFELHVEQEDADGAWGAWLSPPDSTCDSYAGFLWAALGNPSSKIRWEATHCIHKLVSLNCQDVINSLFENYYEEDIGSFGSNRFPFYFLHARLYLLIGLYRGAQDRIDALISHDSLLFKIAATSSHAFIEYLASQIALKISNEIPGKYDAAKIDILHSIGKSPFCKINDIDTKDVFITPFHERNEIDTSLDLMFFSDFEQYWLRPLARVFNVSSGQLHQLASHIVINEWGISSNEKFLAEPRQELWRYSDKKTYSRHSDIPETEPYDFYLAYHAMYTIASRLLEEMPIVENSYGWVEDEWKEWFDRDYLSRHDGYWLADRRDPFPIERSSSVFEDKGDDWRWGISKNDFLESLLLNKNGVTFVCVHGSWNDNDGKGNGETFDISSAMASADNSMSLLTALVTCSNSYDVCLPSYNEESLETDLSGFCLKGWVVTPESNKRLDDSDPHTGDIRYPPIDLNPEVVKNLNLNHDIEKREYKDSDNHLVAFNELWSESSGDDRYTERLVRYGNRLYVSLKELLTLSKHAQSDFIFKVQISRESSIRNYNRDDSDEIKYPQPYFNLYCLTSDGKLRESTASYQLR